MKVCPQAVCTGNSVSDCIDRDLYFVLQSGSRTGIPLLQLYNSLEQGNRLSADLAIHSQLHASGCGQCDLLGSWLLQSSNLYQRNLPGKYGRCGDGTQVRYGKDRGFHFRSQHEKPAAFQPGDLQTHRPAL